MTGPVADIRRGRTRRVLFVDGSQGASGDMILGALVDLGVPSGRIRVALEGLPVEGWAFRARPIVRCGLAASKADVEVRGEQPCRGWSEIREIVEGGTLEPVVRDRALAVFRRLIEAEATVHGRDADTVHLHEAGGTDALVDVVGACAGLAHLEIDEIVVSPLTTGFGEIRCAHGVYPVPAPATALLLRGVPAQGGSVEAERLTPTGAAVLTTVADRWGSMPAFRPVAVGYGAGTRDLGDVPNMLRMILGERDGDGITEPSGTVAVLEATMDDATPQALAFASALLLKAGALDVGTSSVTMKKGRVGHRLTVLARPEDRGRLARQVLRHTTTLGLRVRIEERYELARSVRRVECRYGTVEVKVGELNGEVLQVWPEYEACAALAEARGVSLRQVQEAALEAYRASRDNE